MVTFRSSAAVVAAVLAVCLWALKPVFISLIGDRGGYAEVYIVAGAVAVGASLLGAAVLHRKTKALLRGGRKIWIGVGNAALSGAFLAVWYYGFYRALYESSKVDATVIAFTWPLVTALAMPLLSPKTAPRLRGFQWLLILVSFAGVTLVSVSSADGTAGDWNINILWAVAAALGSGLYLPFAIKAMDTFEPAVQSKPASTFYAISVANVVALAGMVLVMAVTGQQTDFSGFNTGAILICALIGLGTYLAAEVAWTWSFQEQQSLTLAALPYFSPAMSVLLLALFFHEPVRILAVAGLVVILAANLALLLGKNRPADDISAEVQESTAAR